MTSLLNRIFSFRHHVVQEPKKVTQGFLPLKQAVNGAFKELSRASQESECFLASIKDAALRNQRKNERNIFLYFIGCDLKNIQPKPSDLKIAVNYCIRRSSEGGLSDFEKAQICNFFEKISILPQELFNRPGLLKEQTALQRILSPELDQLLSAQDKEPSLVNDNRHQLDLSIAKAKLSVKLGFGVSQAGNGVNGARIIRDLENKPVGVFKPKPQVKWYQISEMMKHYFGQARLLSQQDPLAQQFAEVAAHEFNEMMGFKMVPAASMVELNNEEGAFLAFLGGYKELKECEEAFEARSSYEKQEKILWQMKCLYTFVVGNMDPHSENVFVRLDDKGKLVDIRMIDHGNSFIEYNPGAWGSKGNQGHWGHYKISGEKFEPEVLDFIQNSLTEGKLDTFVAKLGDERKHFWTIRMDTLQRDRLRILRDCVLAGTITNPKELSGLHTNQDYQKYFERVKPADKEEVLKTQIGDFSIIDIR